jgi:anti-sigma regulatory factor (Ser/Thr protein kinase)
MLEHRDGRGLVLMKNFMDEVRFNETGNEVTMILRSRHPET